MQCNLISADCFPAQKHVIEMKIKLAKVAGRRHYGDSLLPKTGRCARHALRLYHQYNAINAVTPQDISSEQSIFVS